MDVDAWPALAGINSRNFGLAAYDLAKVRQLVSVLNLTFATIKLVNLRPSTYESDDHDSNDQLTVPGRWRSRDDLLNTVKAVAALEHGSCRLWPHR